MSDIVFYTSFFNMPVQALDWFCDMQMLTQLWRVLLQV